MSTIENDDVLALAMQEATAEETTGDESSVDVGDVATVADLVNLQIALETEIEETNKRLNALVMRLEEVRTKSLPDAMLEMNVASWTTIRDGRRLTVKLDELFYPSVRKEDMPRFVEWLKKRGDEGIVKPKFVVDFEKGQVEEASDLLERMRREHPDLPIKYEPEIHWATFRAFTKEVITTEGEDSVPSFYRFHRSNMAKITSRKI